MRRKSDTLLWGSWLFANKTMMRVKQSCAWLEWRVWELKNRGLSQYPVEVGWVTLGIQIVCARCLANIRVRHSQKQVKNPNTHIYWFKIPRSFNVGGFNMAEEHPYCDFFFFLSSRNAYAKPVATSLLPPGQLRDCFQFVLLYTFHHYLCLKMKNRSRNCKVNELIHQPLSYSSAIQLNTFHLILRQ